MSVPLPPDARDLFARPVYATVATVEPNDQPQLSVVWLKTDADDVVFSTVQGRRKHQNLERSPRVSVLAIHPDNPNVYVEVRGTATMTTEGGPELIQELSHKYNGQPYTKDDGTDNVRVVVRITAEKVVVRKPR